MMVCVKRRTKDGQTTYTIKCYCVITFQAQSCIDPLGYLALMWQVVISTER